MAAAARDAQAELGMASHAERQAALRAAADAIRVAENDILAANAKDLEAGALMG